jgi:serine O-acetyltransferase
MNPLLKEPNEDPFWDAIRQTAEVLAREEPVLGRLANVGILKQACFEGALSYILAQRLGNDEVPVMLLHQLFDALLAADARIGTAARADLAAVCERDPACNSTLEVLLFRKGFHALQTYRLAHALLHQGRRALALFLQDRMNLVFGIDINPSAQLGLGILITAPGSSLARLLLLRTAFRCFRVSR